MPLPPGMHLRRILSLHRRAELLAVVPLRDVTLNDQGRLLRRPRSSTKGMKMNSPTGLYLRLVEYRKSVRLLVAALAGHGIFDIKHFHRLTNPNLPIWLALLWIGLDLLMTAFGCRRVAKTPFGFQLPEVQSS